MKTQNILIALFLLFISSRARAIEERQIDELFENYKNQPGCAIGVAKNGKTVYVKGYGIANFDYSIPITDSSVFNIASMSKQFTAACAAILMKEGKLSLDDDVNHILPELKRFDDTIKIRHLIHHSCGLWPYEQLLFIGCFNMGNFVDVNMVLNWVNNQDTLMFKPGSKFAYCNTGYVLLGLIIERIAKCSLNEFAKNKIFQPLGMNSTFYYDNRNVIIPNRAVSYEKKDGGYIRFLDNHVICGDGGIHTNIIDLITWHRFLFNDTKRSALLGDYMFQTDTFPNGKKNNYAFGLYDGNYKGNYYRAHAGFIHGYRTNMCYFPSDSLFVVVLSNSASFDSHKATYQLSDILLEKTDTTKGFNGKYKMKKEPEFMVNNFNDYLATFHWDLFNVDYRFYIHENRLMLKRGKLEPIAIKFIKQDVARFFYSNLPFDIIFIRDNNGIIKKLIVKSVRGPMIDFFKID